MRKLKDEKEYTPLMYRSICLQSIDGGRWSSESLCVRTLNSIKALSRSVLKLWLGLTVILPVLSPLISCTNNAALSSDISKEPPPLIVNYKIIMFRLNLMYILKNLKVSFFAFSWHYIWHTMFNCQNITFTLCKLCQLWVQIQY